MNTRTGILGSLAVAMVVALGALVLWLVVGSGAVESASRFFRESFSVERLVVRMDGTSLIEHRQYTGYNYRLREVTYRSLEDKPEPIESGSLSEIGGASLAAPSALRRERYLRDFDWNWTLRIDAYSGPEVFWYFIQTGEAEGAGYFEGYDRESRRLVGYLGRAGFRSDKPPRQDQFAVEGREFARWSNQYNGANVPYARHNELFSLQASGERIPEWIVYLLADNRIVEVDLKRRSTRTVSDEPGFVAIGMIYAALDLKPEEDGGSAPGSFTPRRQHLCGRTLDRVLVFDREAKTPRVYRLPSELQDKSFDFYVLPGNRALLAVRSELGANMGFQTDLYWLNAAGEIVRREEAVMRGPSHSENLRSKAFGLAAVAPAPALDAAIVSTIFPMRLLTTNESETLPGALALAWSYSWPALLVISALSALCAWICARQQAKYAEPWTKTWVVFVFLFGLPGLLGYLWRRRWPVLEKCPSCQAASPRDRLACARCHADFPEPSALGLEVLA